MYNRYIPADADYLPVEEEPSAAPEPRKGEPPLRERPEPSRRPQTPAGPGGLRLPPFLAGKEGLSALFGRERSGLSGLLRSVGLEDIDTGDILLLLIILYLLVEGDDLELVIALGLVLLMGLGGERGGE